MALFQIKNRFLHLTVSEFGGTILQLEAQLDDGRTIPLLRPSELSEKTDAIHSCCFPLVPFGNRVRDNHFQFEGKSYQLTANTQWDRHYLHGDGWLNHWRCIGHSDHSIELEYHHQEGIYQYVVKQCFTLEDQSLLVTLEVMSLSEHTLPFGLGWHPYFPLTKQTTLQAKAKTFYLEDKEWLAGERVAIPDEFNFTQPQGLPRKWVNNAWEGWDGQMLLHIQENNMQLTMTTDPVCPVYFIFVSDPQFDPGYDYEFFCFEPMSHCPDAHNMKEGGFLKKLNRGDVVKQAMRLSYRQV